MTAKLSPTQKEELISRGLGHARRLGDLLREGSNAKRKQMTDELQSRAEKRDAAALTRSLATCADASLGDTVDQSNAIRAEAGQFRDTIVALPPDTDRRWSEISDALTEKAATNTQAVPEAASAGCAPAGGFAPVSPQLSLFPTTSAPSAPAAAKSTSSPQPPATSPAVVAPTPSATPAPSHPKVPYVLDADVDPVD